jgi:hypothetical protein
MGPWEVTSATTLRRIHTLVPSHSKSSRQPVAQRRYPSGSAISAFARDRTMRRHIAFAGSKDHAIARQVISGVGPARARLRGLTTSAVTPLSMQFSEAV